jgi:glutamate N-acetyltransferase/amino-acid N-acetyltransferase
MKIGKRKGTIAGVCKGAGMICPNMATMLSFLITDINISGRALDRAFRDAVQGSFNRVTVDGDMSTNDTILMMANGLAENDLVDERSRSFSLFSKGLSDVAGALSRLIVKDGEGATKLVEITVKNAVTKADAEKGAYAIANSLLVKTALYGNDANWGRIIAALGYSGITMREERTDIYVGRVKITNKGLSTGSDREAGAALRSKEVSLTVDLHLGTAFAKVLTCDLTEEYVRINAGYRS